jgi:hypothetical protein
MLQIANGGISFRWGFIGIDRRLANEAELKSIERDVFTFVQSQRAMDIVAIRRCAVEERVVAGQQSSGSQAANRLYQQTRMRMMGELNWRAETGRFSINLKLFQSNRSVIFTLTGRSSTSFCQSFNGFRRVTKEISREIMRKSSFL